jgi:hypothetical protein
MLLAMPDQEFSAVVSCLLFAEITAIMNIGKVMVE